MKRTILLFILAAAPAFGQWHHFGEARATGFFGVGATAPVNPTARITDTGWNFAGGIGVTKNYLGLMLDFSFNDLGLNRSTLRQFGATRGSEKFWALTVDPVFHVNQRGPVDFYVTGGGGLYGRISTLRAPSGFGGPFSGADEVVSSFTRYKPGVDGGAGFSFNVGYTNRVKVFLEARYHHMFTPGSGESFVPVTLGVRF
jgi:hypothetical protein